jgi:hypothetical protein
MIQKILLKKITTQGIIKVSSYMTFKDVINLFPLLAIVK